MGQVSDTRWEIYSFNLKLKEKMVYEGALKELNWEAYKSEMDILAIQEIK